MVGLLLVIYFYTLEFLGSYFRVQFYMLECIMFTIERGFRECTLMSFLRLLQSVLAM